MILKKPVIHNNPQKEIKNSLNNIKRKQRFFHNLLKKQKDVFSVDKKIPKKAIDEFVKKYVSGYFKKGKNIKKIHEEYDMYAFPLTKSTLATVRKFDSYKSLKDYLEYVNIFYNKLKKANPKNFKISPVDVVDVRKVDGYYMYIEKVHPIMDAWSIREKPIYENLIKNPHRYHKSLDRFLNKNKLSYKEYTDKLTVALKEYSSILKNSGIDKNPGNVLVLDYNPKKDLFLFGGIDFKGSNYSL